MARLAALPHEKQTLTTRFCRWLIRRVIGRELRPYGVFAHAPRAAPAFVALNMLFETGNWAIEPALRKLVHLRVAQLIGCVF
jgi:alkylhydroperoxidase family enzyme